MDIVIELLKITLPAIIVCYAIYLIVRTFVFKELETIRIEKSTKSLDAILPVRIQAYERMCLFLERISPGNIIPRLNSSNLSARELQTIILNEIREEFNHNLSQQLYMSDNAWETVKLAMETTIFKINEAAATLAPDANNMDLVREIFDKNQAVDEDTIRNSLTVVKDEIRGLF